VLTGVREFLDGHSLAQTREYTRESLAGEASGALRQLAQQDPSFREARAAAAQSGTCCSCCALSHATCNLARRGQEAVR
jgi:hypothetical protein